MPKQMNAQANSAWSQRRQFAPSLQMDATGYLEFHLEMIEQLSSLPLTPEVSALLQSETTIAHEQLVLIQNQSKNSPRATNSGEFQKPLNKNIQVFLPMKNKQLKQNNFQKIYASEFMTLLSFAVTIELFVLVMLFFGGIK